MMFDSGPASRLPINPSLGFLRREAAIGRFVDVLGALSAVGILVLMVALSGHAGYARASR
jgi:hypothetical protein